MSMFAADKDQSLGFVHVDRLRLIECCELKIAAIEKERAERIQSVKNSYLEDDLWWHNRLWKYFGFRAPTEGCVPPLSLELFGASIYGSQTEYACNKILSMAKASDDDLIMVSDGAISASSYTKKTK